MKFFFVFALALASTLSLPLIASAQSFSVTVSPECGAGPVMYQYDLPRHDSGDISLTNSLEMPGDDLPVVEMAGAPICLADGQQTVYLLNVGYGPGIGVPSYEVMVAVALIIEREATDAAFRAFAIAGAENDGS